MGYSVFHLWLVKAELGRFNIQVMEEGKNQTTFFFILGIWKADGKLLLREILFWLTEKRRFALFLSSIYFSHIAVRLHAIRSAITRTLKSGTNGWLK